MRYKYTVRALVEPLGNEARLDAICRVFSSMVRTAYNRLLKGERENEIVQLLQARYGIKNWRWCQWAIRQAQAVILSQRKLLLLHVKMYNEKIAKVKRKMDRIADPLKKRGYRARIDKLERKRAAIEKHIKAGTVPRAVFGSKELLKGLSKGNGDIREWRRRRSGQFLSIGQASKKGNANTRIIKQGCGYTLEIRNWPSCDFRVGLKVPQYYQRLLDAALASGVAYSVCVKRTKRNYQTLISFKVDETPTQPWNGKRLAAMDVNPEGVAVTVVSVDGNLLASRWFHEPALVHARAEKRRWLAANLVKHAFKWAKGYGCNAVVIEKLRFGIVQEGNHSANRIYSNFPHKKLIRLVKLRALKLNWICAEVDARYSSVAGELKYGRRFSRFNRHQLAALVLGRRALGYGERLDQEQLKKIPKRRHVHATKAISPHGHRHELLRPCMGTDGRMLGGDAKGASAGGERVTPHTAATSALLRLSLLLGGGCPGDEPGARGYGVNPPPARAGVKLGSVNEANVT